MEGYAPVLEPEACRITEFLPIFIRRSSLELERSGCFFLSPHPEDPESIAWGARLPRHCLWARLRVRATQQSFYLFNVHLSHRSAEARERSVELLLRRTAEINDEGHPVVLVGDFNARPASGCIAALKGHGFRDAHAGFAGGTAHGFSGIPFGPRLDYIFVSGSLRVRSATIDRSLYRGRLPSDHFPVLADVAW
jgi:endonuclease/exonuclease/phosphatase family metal-dependent hydrolase